MPVSARLWVVCRGRETLCDATVAQTDCAAVATFRQSVEENQKKADAAFKGSARPASFERGKQALADSDKP